jgi:hypothetical protein
LKPAHHPDNLKGIWPGGVKHGPSAQPGTELNRLLYKFGFKPAPNCKCNQHIAEMNQKGAEWCEQNVDTIVGWLREEAERIKRDKQASIERLKRINSSGEERPSDAAMAQLKASANATIVPFTAIGAKILVKRAIHNAKKKLTAAKTAS